MAAVFAQHHCDTRQAGRLYAAWRQGSAAIRKRILDAPDLFFKTQRREVKPSPTAPASLMGDPPEAVLVRFFSARSCFFG